MLSLGTVSIRLPQIGSPSGRFFSTAGMQDPLLRPGSELRAVGGGVVPLVSSASRWNTLDSFQRLCTSAMFSQVADVLI